MSYLSSFFKFFAPVALFISASSINAADASRFKNLGFSKDGKIYAFEEYGVQDGSGFAYSSIYIVDTDRDRWVSPSPYKNMARDERTELKKIRDRSLSDATPQLRRLGVNYDGEHLVSRKLSDLGLSSRTVAFTLDTDAALYDNMPYSELVHETFPMRSPNAYCDGSGRQTMGFNLTYVEGNKAKVVYRDERLSKSRGCPYEYKIAEILKQEDKLVAIIAIRSRGFEGLDRRLIAIPFAIPTL